LSHSASPLPLCSSILTFPQAHQSGSCLRTYTHTSASNTLPLTVHRSPSLQPQAFCLNTWAPFPNYARKQQHPWPYAFSYFSSYAYCHVVALCLLDTAGFCPEKLFLWGIEVWTQDLELVRQAVHHLSLNHNFCLFVLVIFQVRSPVSIWGQSQTTVFLPMAFCTIARITNLCQQIWLLIGVGLLTFCQGWPWMVILPISTFLLTGIIMISHHAQSVKNVGFGSWLGLFCPLLYASMIYWSKEWATHRWLVSGILATQEAEIRRITVQSQPWENSSRDPI
jgi:hypothetical protein